LKKTVNFIITTTKTLHLAKILLYSNRNLDLYFLGQRVLRVLTDKIPHQQWILKARQYIWLILHYFHAAALAWQWGSWQFYQLETGLPAAAAFERLSTARGIVVLSAATRWQLC
jgi:hypothetical protein